jgi:hypothetical protein
MAGMLFKRERNVLFPEWKRYFPEPQIIPVFGGALYPFGPLKL